MKFGRTITAAMLAGLFTLSAQARTETVSVPTWPQEPSEAAQALEQSIRDCGPEAKTSVWSYGNNLHVMYLNSKARKSCGYFVIQMDFQQTKCKGVNTFALALNGGSLTHGKFRNIEGRRVADLFGTYHGSALGAGLIVGAGHWEARKENGVTYGDKRTAIPLPILSETTDLALGFTSCDFSSNLSPKGPVELKSRGFSNEPSKTLNINDVANLPLFSSF